MANLTDRYENKLLDGFTGVVPLTTPAIIYLALFTADPTDAGSVVSELSGNGYARKSLAGLFPAASGTDGSVSNTSIVNFSTATADWAEVTHVGFMESGTATTDDMIIGKVLDFAITTLNTEVFSFAIGDLTITAA